MALLGHPVGRHAEYNLLPGRNVRESHLHLHRAHGHICHAFRVKPYKLKKGETVDAVALDKGMETHELQLLNHELQEDDYKEGQSILVPQARMSEGDRLILKNMIERKYRTYAVQGHETIEDIMQARQLEWSEVEGLNPGTDLDDLKPREIIKLPAHKYSAHEQYEMQGTFGSPQAFHVGSVLMNSVLAGTLAISLYAFWLFRESKKAKAAAEMEKKIAASRKKYEVPKGLPLPSYMASLDESEDIETAPE